MSIKSNIESFNSKIPEQVQLVVVSKTHPVDKVMEAYDAGHRHFGENRVQELTEKAEKMPDDIRWHLIGHLQTNKVKYIVDFVHLIHSVDSLKLLKEIEKRAAKANRVVDVLLQVHIADEESKFGLIPEKVAPMVEALRSEAFRHVCVKGLMGMATFTDDQQQVRTEFAGLKALFDRLKSEIAPFEGWDPQILSMGMSGDWEVAVDNGSNMIRVGSAIFGAR